MASEFLTSPKITSATPVAAYAANAELYLNHQPRPIRYAAGVRIDVAISECGAIDPDVSAEQNRESVTNDSPPPPRSNFFRQTRAAKRILKLVNFFSSRQS